jgi:hypothetical protein
VRVKGDVGRAVNAIRAGIARLTARSMASSARISTVCVTGSPFGAELLDAAGSAR